MLARVNADRLNVRTLPDSAAAIRTVITENHVVHVEDTVGNWRAIRAGDLAGYVYSDYLTTDPNLSSYYGIVDASFLNVRAGPSVTAESLGMLRGGSRVDVTSTVPDWLEIRFNDALGYVADDYVELHYSDEVSLAQVTADVLNVRSTPGGQVVGQVALGTRLAVHARFGDWSEVAFNGALGYVTARYLMVVTDDFAGPAPVADNEIEEPVPVRAVDLTDREVLAPAQQLPVRGSSEAQNGARTWNHYGGLLETLSARYGIDVACAVAVLSVESSGQGFAAGNQNRMVIRFENHKFWQFWGKDNAQRFSECFRYRVGKAWKDHEFRRSSQDEWRSFHGNQRREWEVFEFARAMNEPAAIQSISMGAPQIMGFHYERLGYQTPVEMLDDFSTDMAAHIRGLFAFFDRPMVRALQTLDFVGFARRYNGSGQQEVYGKRIDQHYQAFKALRR